MIIAVLSAGALAAAATASPPPQSQPLRQVSYKVSWGSRYSSAGEHYQGYSSTSSADHDSGTVTVAVMGVGTDGLLVNVTEDMGKSGRPATFSGVVTSDGIVQFPPDTINDVSRELLQFFAPHFVPPDKTDVGAGWDVVYDKGGLSLKYTYKVTKLDGPLMTLAEDQNIKVATENARIHEQGTIVLKPALLVPISGDVQRITHQTRATGDTETEINLHFERVSDSRDGPST